MNLHILNLTTSNGPELSVNMEIRMLFNELVHSESKYFATVQIKSQPFDLSVNMKIMV
jgi:hypothetical protein